MTPPSTSPITYSVHGLTSVDEVQVAAAAVKQFRAGDRPPSPTSVSAVTESAETTIDLVEKAVRNFPSNPQKELLQRVLFEAPAGVWVTFDSIKTAFTKAGLKASQASAALRDLSWQIGQVFPAEALANLDANICIMAERMRSAGSFNYRLTDVGRSGLGRVLKH